MRKSVAGPTKDEVTRYVEVKKTEAVRFITIEPVEWGKTFSITFKMKKKVMSGGKASVGEGLLFSHLHILIVMIIPTQTCYD